VLTYSEKTEYLGRLLGFSSFHDAEIDHRIAKAWAKFHKFKKELCCKDYPLKDRLRLFNAVITPSVLYGSCSWTMTRDRERRLQVAHRRMLRYVCQTRRKILEDGQVETWVEWVQRATDLAEKAMRDSGGEAWVVVQRRKKWRWAGRVARLSDQRWTHETLYWEPARRNRSVGRPRLRWADAFATFFDKIEGMHGDDWHACAQCAGDWQKYEDMFCQ